MNDNGLRRWWIDIPAGGPAGRLLPFLFVCLLQFTAFPDSAQAQWTEVALPEHNNLNMEWVWADSLHGYIFGLYFGPVIRTTDGGFTWTLDTLTLPAELQPESSLRFSFADFKNRDFGVVSYKEGRRDSVLIYTIDGGMTWGYNLIETKSPIMHVMNPPGSRLQVDRNRGLYLFYARSYDDGVPAWVINYSDDIGATWREIAADTLQDWSSGTPFYGVLDSLTQYYCVEMHDPEFSNSSRVRFTTDGGATWQSPQAPHPLSGSLNEIYKFDVINDTSIALTTRYSDWRPGFPTSSRGIVSTDIRRHAEAGGWNTYRHPFLHSDGSDKDIFDILYDNGTTIVNIGDSVIVFRENPPNRPRKLHIPNGGLFFPNRGSFYLSPDGRLWHLGNSRVWVLDYQTLGAGRERPAIAGIEGFSCYPQPFANGSDIMTLRMRSGTRQEGAVISLFDAVGRRFYEKEIGGFGPGKHTVQLDLSGVAFAHLPANTIVFIELRTKDQLLYTKSLFINNR
ncbi:MAG: hypothetical protein KFH87_12255 [Bacteroidetes bacterium]|nr:hypothetical protein [Bacteroidota bacterium]